MTSQSDRRGITAWRPTEADELRGLVAAQLDECSEEQRCLFKSHSVEFYQVPIRRMRSIEQVFVIAEFENRLLYYEYIEEGFELASLDSQGIVPSQGCNQFELRHVLAQLISQDIQDSSA